MSTPGDPGPMPAFRNPFANIPRLTIYIASGLAVGYFASWFPGTQNVLALVAGNTFGSHYYVWNIFTSGYFQDSFIGGLFSVIGVLLIGKYLEPVWGSKEFLKYIVIVNALSGIAMFFLLFTVYAVNSVQFEKVLFYPVCGFTPVLSAFAVAMKQLMPNHEISFLFAFQFKAKYVPVLFVLLSLLLSLIGGALQEVAYSFYGLIFGWMYLRFFKDNGDGTHGDSSPTFSFASFFPDVLSPVCSPVGHVFYMICCRWWRGPAEGRGSGGLGAYHNVGSRLGGSAASLPGSNPQDAERRRQKALQALNSRLNEPKPADSNPASSESPV
mmetsp:Transcript_599/g.1008  ORF Transcript_599/g.1008 Transcript_599/m.1008 type:complete len:326 (-) Transcript_599:57-1034(-)|eukprot:CAMPEP_0184655820 /NCGR_PEP_ID=MMETSP0308-20130426/14506_1 /TAXON_ID=38269 /ORGANISM="Gloeochaete witrockiana, Strain SAG 46.84" /LENGTH=325 /DNA_ID=CAMNT_0027092579 /DNA_START=80 /DNA_END=1057 /DNA_ORIENTATION=+